MPNVFLLVSAIIFAASLSAWSRSNEFCNNPSVKQTVLNAVKYRVVQQPRPYIQQLASYNERSGMPDSCCVDFYSEPHPDRPYCAEAFRTFCYNIKNRILDDSHNYNRWCDY